MERGQSCPPVHPSPPPRSADNLVRRYPHHLHLGARTILSAALFLLLALPAAAALVVESHGFTELNLTPPDGSPVGVVDSRTLTSSIAQITDVNVSFVLAGAGPGLAYNGDYYVSLQHNSGFAILLNRVGRRTDPSDPSATYGYGDNGFQVTFDDQAAHGDIHNYRFTLSNPSSHITPIDAAYALSPTFATGTEIRLFWGGEHAKSPMKSG